MLARTTNFNVTVEQYLSAVFLIVSIGLFIWSHKRRSTDVRLWRYIPVVALMLSFAQFQNTLWGFQMAWYLILLMLAVTVFLLDRTRLTWPVLAGAVVAAVIGSFSSLMGLLIWPAGVVLLYARSRPGRLVIAWVCAAVATGGVYFYGFNGRAGPMQGGFLSTLEHPIIAGKFLILVLGEVVDAQISRIGFSGVGSRGAFDLGLVILLGVIVTLAAYGLRRDDSSGRPIGVVLICFGLLFAATITEGRLLEGGMFAGFGNANQPRFTTFTLLIPAGIYLVFLDTAERRSRQRGNTGRIPAVILWAVIIVVVPTQVVWGNRSGVYGARFFRTTMILNARVLVNIDHYPDSSLDSLLVNYEPRGQVRRLAEFVETHHLSLFGTAAAAGYSNQGLFRISKASNTRGSATSARVVPAVRHHVFGG